MRIGINALAVSPERPGGDVTYVRELVRRLPALAPDDSWTVFLTPRARDLLPAAGPNVRLVDCRLPSESTVVRALWEQVALPRLLHRERLEVLHAPVNVAPLAARLPVVLTVHEAEPFMPDNHIPPPLLAWWRVVRARSARQASRVLTVSHAARRDLVRWMRLAPERVGVVHLGVDHERFTPGGAREPGAADGDPWLLWVGRPYPGKNLGRLVEALAAVRRAGRRERLLLVGPPGWAERDLAAAIERHGCADAVVRRGAVWHRLPELYRACSAFVYPSTRESFGLPVLEAMACAAPVVAGDIPALREVGGEAAEFADPSSAEALASALRRVLTDGSRRDALRAAGPPRAALFTWHATAARTLEAYRSAHARAGRAA